MRNTYDFKFGDYWLSELGGMMTESPDIEFAERDVNFIEIPGKDGSDIIDNRRYKNVEFSRSVAFVSRNDKSADEKVKLCLNDMAYLYGYRDFEDTDHPGMITKAALKNFGTVSKTLRTLKTAELEFSREPFWYLKSSLKEEKIFDSTIGSVIINNPYNSTCKPTLLFRGNCSGASANVSVVFTIWTTIDGEFNTIDIRIENVQVDNLHKIIEVDLSKERVIVRSENGEIKSFVDMEIPYELGQGEITLILGQNTNLSSVGIIPRWRCL